MILKGSQRGGGQDLAAHLMRTDENEHVEIHEIRGFASDTLAMAFKEAHAISRGTKCQQYLFSLSLNPPEAENVPVEAFEKAIDEIEQKLGLNDQPRAIVFHEKEGRRHAHAVWSRIDADEMKARQLSHFKRKLTDISRELYLEHDWKMPRGLESPALRDPTNFTLAEWQQAKRLGIDPRELKQTVQDCWAASDSRASFEHALKARGFWLARGDRRGFVILDYQGEVYSLSRALGIKAKEVRARLGDPDNLRNVEDAKRAIGDRMTPALKHHIEDARASIKQGKAVFDHQKAVMTGHHQAARKGLREKQRIREETEAKTRSARFRKGLRGLWDRITGQHGQIKKINAAEAAKAQRRDGRERQTMVESQLKERRILQTKIKALRKRQADLLRGLRRDAGHYLRLGRGPEPPPRRRQRRSLRL